MLADKVAVVTGAAAGIGAEVAVRYAAAGARVALVDRDAAGLEAVAARIDEAGGETVRVPLDLSDAAATIEAVTGIENRMGRIDVLANVAGITGRTDFDAITLDSLDAMYAVNLRSTFVLIQHVARGMRERRYGKIVNTASISAVRGQGSNAHYSAMKAGVLGLTRSAAKALGPFQITVNAVCPVAVTALTRDYPDLQAGRALPPRSLNRAGEPADVAPTYLFLASPHSDYVTGVTVHCDGGFHLGQPA
ncbi:SDR family NAD(P)-dependent oxidoreductase [Pseudonocardia benzenivorans]|uniref:SDR family NAD(P)-dependent oxidoreductase n=1 Tax=Pseudonocardia benzenivorans TaxID=228005 RepID=A0ABW3VBT3_9PSEU|nr:SDR family NAD(P)-dependent oxidoreductase [Pseudonocardia dioxanivorans]